MLLLILFTIIIRSNFGTIFISDFTSLLFSKYETYLTDEKLVSNFGVGLILTWILVFYNIAVILFVLSKLKQQDHEELVILKLAVLFWVISLIGAIGLSSRFYFYFIPFLIVASTIIAKKTEKNIYVNYSYIFLIVFYFLYYFITVWTKSDNFNLYFRDYHTIFS